MRFLPFFVLVACSPARPLTGPGYTPADGVLTDAEGPFIAVVTHARHNKGRGGDFDRHVSAISDQLDAGQSGYVARSLRARIPGRDRWTLTVWEDEESLAEFALGGAHLEAMSESAEILEISRSTWWTVEPDEMPPRWSDALDRLETDRPL